MSKGEDIGKVPRVIAWEESGNGFLFPDQADWQSGQIALVTVINGWRITCARFGSHAGNDKGNAYSLHREIISEEDARKFLRELPDTFYPDSRNWDAWD